MACNNSQPLSARVGLVVLALVSLTWAVVSSHACYTHTAITGALLALTAMLAAATRGADRVVSTVPSFVPGVTAGAVVFLIVQFLTFPPCDQRWVRWFLVPGVAFLGWRLVTGEFRHASPGLAVLAACGLVLSGRAVNYTHLLGDGPPQWLVVVRAAAGIGFLLVAALAGLDLSTPGERARGFGLRLALLFAAGGVVRLASVLAAPDPHIDVYDWLRRAPAELLHGNNPYAVAYVPQGRLPTYPPLAILLALPFSAGGLDVRLANVAADVVAGWALYRLARRHGRPLQGALAAGIYLHLPGVPYLLRHAWFEPMLAAALGLGLGLAEAGGRLGHLLLGVGLTGKQFGLPLLLPLSRAMAGQRFRLAAGVGLALAVVVLPFFLWSPADFLQSVLLGHLHVAPDLYSLTLRAAAQRHLGWAVPNWLMMALTVTGVGWVAARTPAGRGRAALGMASALLVFCLGFVKGYFNYFFLCLYLLLLALAALPPEGESVPVAGTDEETVTRAAA